MNAVSLIFDSKLSRDHLRQHISEMYQEAADKKRNFVETIELQIALKNYDPTKDKRFSGSVRLPSAPKAKFRVCVLADAAHMEEAQKNGVPCMDAEALKALKKGKKQVRDLGMPGFIIYLSKFGHSEVLRRLPRLGYFDQANPSFVGPWFVQGWKVPFPFDPRRKHG